MLAATTDYIFRLDSIGGRVVPLELRYIYTGIRVKDMDESLRFYTGVMGMTVVEPRERTQPTKGEVVTLKSRDSPQLLELNWYAEDSPFFAAYRNGEELDHLAFDVEDLDSAAKEMRAMGVEVVVTPGQIGGWREAFVKDPNGIWIELLERKRGSAGTD